MQFLQVIEELLPKANPNELELLEALATIKEPTQQQVDQLNKIRQTVISQARLERAIDEQRKKIKSKVLKYISHLNQSYDSHRATFAINPVLDKIDTNSEDLIAEFTAHTVEINQLATSLKKNTAEKIIEKIQKTAPTIEDMDLSDLELYTVTDFVTPTPAPSISITTHEGNIIRETAYERTLNLAPKPVTKSTIANTILNRTATLSVLFATILLIDLYTHNKALESQSESQLRSESPLQPTYETFEINYKFEGTNANHKFSHPIQNILTFNDKTMPPATQEDGLDPRLLYTSDNIKLVEAIFKEYQGLVPKGETVEVVFKNIYGPKNEYKEIQTIGLMRQDEDGISVSHAFTASAYVYFLNNNIYPVYLGAPFQSNK
jgi:hypothetical protein